METVRVPMTVARGRSVHVDDVLRQPGEMVLLSPDDAAFLQTRGFVVLPEDAPIEAAPGDVRRVDFTMPKRDGTDVARG